MILENLAEKNEEESTGFINKLGFHLPDDYVDFVIKNNGIKVVDGYFYINDLDEFILMDLLYGVSAPKRNLISSNKEFADDLPEESLLIGRDQGGGFILLINNSEGGGIYYYDHSCFFEQSDDEKNTYFITSTFTEFLEMLSTVKPDENS